MDGLHLLGTEADDPHSLRHGLVALLITIQGLGEKVLTIQVTWAQDPCPA